MTKLETKAVNAAIDSLKKYDEALIRFLAYHADLNGKVVCDMNECVVDALGWLKALAGEDTK